jgi:hypothetical protein
MRLPNDHHAVVIVSKALVTSTAEISPLVTISAIADCATHRFFASSAINGTHASVNCFNSHHCNLPFAIT